MSVLYCQMPNFLLGLTYRHDPALTDRPLALLGPDERIWALSPHAAQAGIQLQMTPRQAQLRCPALALRPLDTATCQAEQHAFTTLLTAWQLPVEEADWGAAYLDLRAVAHEAHHVQPLAQELGRQVRTHFGAALQPALGWDSGKFTARAAAAHTAPGRLRLISARAEAAFLAPLPTTLLPLPTPVLQQLAWLGVRTLGQFAALPTPAVTQRWGQPGRLAQQWARGHDDRPVRPTTQPLPPPHLVSFDPPAVLLAPVVHALVEALRPQLQTWANQLAGLRQLQLRLTFTEGSQRLLQLSFIEPVSQAGRLAHTLTSQLQALTWPGALVRAALLPLAQGELRLEQLALFPELTAPPPAAANHLPPSLAQRYGPIFWQGVLTAAQHPVAERRFRYQPHP